MEHKRHQKPLSRVGETQIKNFDPSIMGLQETYVRANIPYHLRLIESFQFDFLGGNKACGRVLTLVNKKSFPPYSTLLQATYNASL